MREGTHLLGKTSSRLGGGEEEDEDEPWVADTRLRQKPRRRPASSRLIPMCAFLPAGSCCGSLRSARQGATHRDSNTQDTAYM
jgi:hypothetical protein